MWRDEVGIMEMILAYIGEYTEFDGWTSWRSVVIDILSSHECIRRQRMNEAIALMNREDVDISVKTESKDDVNVELIECPATTVEDESEQMELGQGDTNDDSECEVIEVLTHDVNKPEDFAKDEGRGSSSGQNDMNPIMPALEEVKLKMQLEGGTNRGNETAVALQNDSDLSSDESLKPPPRKRLYKERITFDFENDEQASQKFRLKESVFNVLEEKLSASLSSQTRRSCALTVKQKIGLACRLLATGAELRVVGDAHGVHKSTSSRILHEFVEAVNNIILPTAVNWPTDEADIINAARDFKSHGGLPSIFGCVDGSHVKIRRPSMNELHYLNRHGTHSLNVMLVCGPDLRFYYVCVKWPGSVDDSSVFLNSNLRERLDEGWRPLRDGVLLGDSGYPNLDYLITPLLRPTSPQELQFNDAHRRTQRLVECAISILKQRFQILSGTMMYTPVAAANIIRCCVALHNLFIEPSDIAHVVLDDSIDTSADQDERSVDSDKTEGSSRRQQFIDIF